MGKFSRATGSGPAAAGSARPKSVPQSIMYQSDRCDWPQHAVAIRAFGMATARLGHTDLLLRDPDLA
jgi:hypothetical protein